MIARLLPFFFMSSCCFGSVVKTDVVVRKLAVSSKSVYLIKAVGAFKEYTVEPKGEEPYKTRRLLGEVPLITKFENNEVDLSFGKQGHGLFPGIGDIVKVQDAYADETGLYLIGESISSNPRNATELALSNPEYFLGRKATHQDYALAARGEPKRMLKLATLNMNENFNFIAKITPAGELEWSSPLNEFPNPKTAAPTQTRWSFVAEDFSLSKIVHLGDQQVAVILSLTDVTHLQDRVAIVDQTGKIDRTFGENGFLKLPKRFSVSSLRYYESEKRFYASNGFVNIAKVISFDRKGRNLQEEFSHNFNHSNIKSFYDPKTKNVYTFTVSFRVFISDRNQTNSKPTVINFTEEPWKFATSRADALQDEKGVLLYGWHCNSKPYLEIARVAGDGLINMRRLDIQRKKDSLCSDHLSLCEEYNKKRYGG